MNGVPLIVGLDIGTTKVCTLIGTLTEDQRVDVRGVGMAPSVGLRKGVIIDPEATTAAVQRSVAEAQQAAGIPLTGAHVYVGVTGDHVQSFNCTGAVDIRRPNQEILPTDVDRVKAAAANGVQNASRDIILERPRDFLVDGEGGISDPVHLTGRRLEVVLHVVTGEHRFLTQVKDCVERADLPVDSLVLEAVATGEAVTTSNERDLGCAVLDLGGGTCDVAVYLDGQLTHTSAIPVGGAHVTFDLSYGLQAKFPDAERLKLDYGSAVPELCDPGRWVRYTDVRGDAKQVEHLLFADIIGPRMEELYELVASDLKKAGVDCRDLGAGVILTGGGSKLKGCTGLAREVLGVMVREGVPQDLAGGADQVRGPKFATAVGLVRCGALDQIRRYQRHEQSSLMGRMRTFWRNFTRIFD